MQQLIIGLVKGGILGLLFQFIRISIHNRKQDPGLKFALDFISIIELATTAALVLACLFSFSTSGSNFTLILGLVILPILYFELRRIVLIGQSSVQLRLKRVPFDQIKEIHASLWTLKVTTQDSVIRIMNPLMTSWRFQEGVVEKCSLQKGGS